ncbi:AEC family transporter [Arthrobacter mangrovi]|uniref:Membrane protein n=1 Tax=Arthrobacter mangrovi TaxID=2966350 RepID=A0ABQ5MYK8_9MICC|nr:AEC family transporter [Arthrobacter mangrovi]GLB69044.1 membrane protein [Arthrobacter mangrovi]
MEGVLLGFGVVLALVAVGFGAAALLPQQTPAMQKGLTPAIYYITNPALMFILLAETDLAAVIGVYTPIALITAALAGGLYALVARLVLRRSGARTAVGAMAASYVNAGNIGIPIALYAVGSSAPVVSVLLAQLLVIAPVYLSLFAWSARNRTAANDGATAPLGRTLVKSIANPVTVATAAGALMSVTGLHLPEVLWTPVEMLGHASIPMLLMLFGMSLYGQKPLSERRVRADVALGSIIKLALMPLIAWAVARFLFGVDGVQLLGVVIMAALPTAQNVFLFSSQFGIRSTLVRDIILLSSLLSLPAVLLVALLLG